jgi:hypothetical protein
MYRHPDFQLTKALASDDVPMNSLPNMARSSVSARNSADKAEEKKAFAASPYDAEEIER